MACESETARLQQCDANQLHDLLTARGASARARPAGSKSKLASKDTRNPFCTKVRGADRSLTGVFDP